jgi:hypothetical protein
MQRLVLLALVIAPPAQLLTLRMDAAMAAEEPPAQVRPISGSDAPNLPALINQLGPRWLAGADLAGADLAAAPLQAAILREADLRRANLARADLRVADLTLADLREADLRGADLTGAILNNANLAGADLREAVLTDAVRDGQTVWPEGFQPGQPVVAPPAAEARQAQRSEALRLQLNLAPPLLPVFAALAQPGDIGRADHVADLGLLAGVNTSARMAVFKSADLAEELTPRLADRFDLLGYNLERGSTNPLDDQADPVAAVARLRAPADRYGLRLVIGPDHAFATSHGVDLAPYADQFVLQVQRVQTEPEQVRGFVTPLAAALRAANPELEIWVQVRAEGEPDALVDLVASLRDEIDGVAILADPQAPDAAAALWERLRAAPMPHTESGADTAPTMAWAQRSRSLLLSLTVQILIAVLLAGALLLVHRVLAGRHGTGLNVRGAALQTVTRSEAQP